MIVDLLSFVDTRVTLREHPLNYLIRNAVHFTFGEHKNELKLRIGDEGMNFRLVIHLKYFLPELIKQVIFFVFRVA